MGNLLFDEKIIAQYGGRLHYRGLFWRYKKDMLTFAKQHHISSNKKMQGVVATWKPPFARHNELGWILLWKGAFLQEIVTHEAVHAAIGWARHKKLDFQQLQGEQSEILAFESIEEQICYSAGYIANQIARITQRKNDSL